MDFFIKCFLVLLTMTAYTVLMSINGDIEQGNEAAEERMLTNRNSKVKEDAGMHGQDRIESGRVSARGVLEGDKRTNQKRLYTIGVSISERFLSNYNVTGRVWIRLRGKFDALSQKIPFITLPVVGKYSLTDEWKDVGHFVERITVGKESGGGKLFPDFFLINTTVENVILKSCCNYSITCGSEHGCPKFVSYGGVVVIQCVEID